MGRRGVEHGATYEVDIVVCSAEVLGGDEVGAEEGRLVGVAARNLKTAHLVIDVEAIAGFDLDRGGTGSMSLGETETNEPVQLCG